MRTRTTLEERVYRRNAKALANDELPQFENHIRAEFKRLARQVRKLRISTAIMCGDFQCQDVHCQKVVVSYDDVLALIKEATR